MAEGNASQLNLLPIRDIALSPNGRLVADQAAARGPRSIERLDARDRAREQVVLSLRLAAGVDPWRFQEGEEAGIKSVTFTVGEHDSAAALW